jgi:hypothetical protein
MKRIVLFFHLILFSLSGFSIDNDPKLLFSVNSQNKARLGIINSSDKAVKLVIENFSEEVFFKKMVEAGQNVFEFYDLSALPDGKYFVKASNPKFEEQLFFTVAKGLVKVDKVNDNKPGFMLVSNEYLLVKFQNINGVPVTIQIKESGNLLVEDTSTDEQLIKKFSLKELLPGEYEAILLINGKEFNYTFRLN